MALGGREVADAYIEVHGDLSPFRRDLRRAARTAGRDGGDAAGREFTDAFNKHGKNVKMADMVGQSRVDEFQQRYKKLADFVAGTDVGPNDKSREGWKTYRADLQKTLDQSKSLGLTSRREFRQISEQIKKMRFDEVDADMDKVNKKMGVLRKATSNMAGAWRRMDGTVKLVLFAIVAAAGPAAAALSGLSAAATAIISATAIAAASIVPLAAALAAGGIAAGLAVSSFEEMKKQFPQIKAGIDSIGKAWEKQSQNFGKQWGAALGPLLTDFGKRLGEFDFGTALGKSMAGITKAFQDVVNSTAFTRFGTALTTDLPKAFEGFGAGIAGVFEHLLNLMAAAAPAAKILGDAFAKWGQQLGDSLNQKDKFQETQNFFKTAASMLQSILGLAGSLGSALGTVFGAGAASGKRLIDALKGLTDEWGKWLKSTEGQNALAKWFANGEKIIMSFKPLLVGLGDALNALSTDKAADQFANFAKSIGDALPKVAEFLNVIAEADILNILSDALNATLDALKPLLPALGQFAKTLGTTLRGIIQKVGPMLGRIFESFKPAVEALSPAIEALGRFMEPIFPIVEAIGTAVGKVASQVFPLLGPAIDKIGTALKPVFKVLQQFGNFIRDVVAPIIGTVLVGAINSVVGFFEGFGRVVQGVIQIVTGIIQGFGQFFTKLFQGDIGGALNALGDGFKMVWDGIINVVSGAVQAIWEFINIMIVGKMVAGVKGALTGIKTVFTNIWNGIKSFMETITNGIKTVVTNVWNGIKSFFGGIMNWFKTTVSNTWNGIKTYFSSVFEAIKGIISTAWNSIKTTTSNIWNGIKTTIANIINGVKSTISNVINSIKSFMSGAWGKIKSDTFNAWNAVKTSITNLIKGAYEGVKKWIGNALNTVKELPGKIKDFFADSGSWLVDAGKNIIQGLINGIDSMGNALINKAKSIADGFINGVKNFFGIHSPSRVMAALGVFIPQGFGIGIDRGGKYVDAAATHMGDAAIDALANNTAYVNAGVAAAEQFANAFDRNVSLAPVVPPVETGIVGGIAGRAGVFSSNGAVVEKSVNIEAGAVVVESKASNEEIVAQQVVDKIAEAVMI